MRNSYRVRPFLIAKRLYWFVYVLKEPYKQDKTGNRCYVGGHFDTETEAREYAEKIARKLY